MAVRNSDNILVGGARIFIGEGSDKKELGWMSGEFKVEEQASSVTIKESEGSTVAVITSDKEVHLTFNLLECNLDTLLLLNPSAVALTGAEGQGFAVGTYQSDKTFPIEVWHKKRSGKYRCTRLFKGKVSGNFTSFLLNQDNSSPIAVDIVAIGSDDKDKNTTNNLYETFECEAEKAPGGGW